ncbi:YmfQ family protein, partial [Paenibacillus larvae]|uniref:putative phage tail protein n=1 Tax=Paenibacillus larvae TaxID=1464 RepID=UPI00227DB599
MNEKLIFLLPEFYGEIKEFQELMKTLDEETLLFQNEIDRLLNNQFVLSSDEIAVKRREDELRIQAYPQQESLDFRRKRIVNRYSTKPPFTIRYLQERLDFLLGRGRATASVNPQKFILKVNTKINDAAVFREVEHTI